MNRDKKGLYQIGTSLPVLLIWLMIIAGTFSTTSYYWQQWLIQQQVNVCGHQLTHFLQRVRQYAYYYNQNLPIDVIYSTASWCVIAGIADRQVCSKRQTRGFIWRCSYPQVQFFKLLGKPGFYGTDNNARTGSIEFGRGTQHLRVVISSRGRIRLCQQSSALSLC